MSDHCGSITEDGAAVCVPGSCRCSTDAKTKEAVRLTTHLQEDWEVRPGNIVSISKGQEPGMWKKIRSA